MDYEKICNRFRDNIVEDYFTANIKSEVTLDTLLTPVIADILTLIGKKDLGKHDDVKVGVNLEVVGEMKLIAKEFPMKKVGEQSYRNCNADYLMYDNGEEGTLYFVELKTARDSFDVAQMKNYIKYIMEHRGKSFGEMAGENFIALLNHVSVTGCSQKEDNVNNIKKAPWREKNGKACLQLLFDHITQYQKGITHVSIARKYLKDKKAVSSKKYLLTAGQLLDCMDANWWNCKEIKLIYIVPEVPGVDLKAEMKKYMEIGKIKEADLNDVIDNNLVFVTFKEIYKHCQTLKDDNLNEYWDWVKDILKDCNLLSPKKSKS